MKKLYYWQGVLGDKDTLSAYNKTIEKLLSGDYKAADLDLKNLKGCRIYSVRVNDTDRLLFSTIEIGGKRYLLLLDVVLNHKYEKSRFFDPQVLKKYLKLHQETLSNYTIDEDSFVPSTDTFHFSDPEEKIEGFQALPAEYYNSGYIELTDEQEAIKRAVLPAVVSGPPGSGKSCMALSLLSQMASQQSESELPILYVTASAGLKENIQAMWEELPIAKTDLSSRVKFLTYDELLESEAKENKFVKEDCFIEWFSTYYKTNRNLANDKLNAEPNIIYQELRIASAYSPEEYLKLGEKKCLIHDKTEKKKLLKIANDYAQYLKANKLLDPSLYQLRVEKPRFAKVIADESQDLSHIQSKTLLALSENQQICYCMDSHQSLADNKSKRPYLQDLLGPAYKNLSLTTAHRCPDHVVAMANQVIKLKRNIVGGSADQQEFVAVPHSQRNISGDVKWITSADIDELKVLEKDAASTQFAVITLPELVDEAKKKFGTPLVFTPEQIKGLEYEKVVVYQLLNDDIYAEANKTLLTKEIKEETPKNRPKNNDDERFGPHFNKLFTSFTRAKNTLVIFQEYIEPRAKQSAPKKISINHRISAICDFLKKALPKKIEDTSKQAPTSSVSTKNISIEDWRIERDKQAQHGNKQQVKMIDEKLQQITAEVLKSKPLPSQVTNIKATAIEDSSSQPANVLKEEKLEVKKPEKLENKFVIYIENLLKTGISEVNLSNLLKHPKAIKLLFDEYSPNKACLFAKLIKDEAHAETFFKVLIKDHSFAKKISLSHLRLKYTSSEFLSFFGISSDKSLPALAVPSLLHGMPRFTHSGWLIFLSLLDDNPDLLNEFTLDDLTATLPAQANENENFSLLNSLACYIEGHKVLTRLFKQKPQLLKSLKVEDLMRPHTDKFLGHENSCVFYWLLTTQEGVAILNQLFRENPEIIMDITLNDLTRPRNALSGKSKNVSLLYYLLTIGQTILKQLLTKNPKLLDKIKIEDLTKPLPIPGIDIKFEHATLLYWFIFRGVSEIFRILGQNPNLLKAITADDLFRTLNVKAGVYENTSTFYWAVTSLDGQDMISRLASLKPDLFKNIKIQDLTCPRNVLSRALENTSALYFLTGADDMKLLKQLLSINPKLLAGINGKDLTLRRNSQAGHLENTSILYNLASSVSAHPILLDLLKQNPSLINEIKTSDLFVTRTAASPGLENVSSFYWLAANPSGREIIMEFMKNPRFIKNIKVEDLTRLRPDKAGEFANASPLYWLAQASEGPRILAELVEKNPELAKNFKLEHFTTHPKGRHSTLQHLTASAEGLKILNLISKSNPKFKSDLDRLEILKVVDVSVVGFSLFQPEEKQAPINSQDLSRSSVVKSSSVNPR